MDIKNLHQVGEKTSKILNKLGIFTDDDLINYYPYRYNVYNFSNELIDNSTLIINVIIDKTTAFLTDIFPDAIGRFFLISCILSFSLSLMSLTI